MVSKKVKITDTTLRDGHQSHLATRMRLEHMLPIAEKMDEIGFNSVEVWGGATFDTCMRYLGEDPWERLRQLKKVFKKTPLQMLLRGQNLVGYKHYADDVVEEFIKHAVSNGIGVLRIFDALNDVRNMEKACEVTKSEGAHAQLTISYTISPMHNLEYYVDLGKTYKEMGADSICIKDMAGIISPQGAYDLVSQLKEKVGLPVQMHCHYTSGMASMVYMKAIEAGLDVVDTAMSPLAMGSSQPATETMVAALKDMEYNTELDLQQLSNIADYFKEVRKEYTEFDTGDNSVDVNVLMYQIPGGMISNFKTQLAQQKALDRLPEVLAEVPKVREDFGYPPLVTPSSQIVGTQAVLNVLAGERYKQVTNEVKAYMKGQYGKALGQINSEVRKKIIGDEEPITCRPADLLEPQMEDAKKEVADLMQQPEDAISYAILPAVAKPFLEQKMAHATKLDLEKAEAGPKNGKPATYPL
ncbi:oxaloacetate decarboxylase alpha subunit [Desulfitispora alkaliphila]|uniref:oxaloacetate decarboxylase subunit alpha n=1 Tax=Desulfitispora alkaliphila TaxID=622674 RepID=UPI003D1A7634